MAAFDALNRKPATPEPPEWKGSSQLTVADVQKAIAKAKAAAPPAQSPLDRALEDFTARRKAKRERAACALDDELCGYESWDAFDAAHEKARIREATQDQISRAMSAPLPHDPPISARLMPWRGKE